MSQSAGAAHVAKLAAPGVLSEQRACVKETHKSYVFLTCSDAYKLKKPLFAGTGHDGQLAARKHAAQHEINLNRRLAASVYHGLAPIYRRTDGGFALAGPGDIVDWAIHMRRLDAGLMLDRLIATRQATALHVHRAGARLADFYRQQPNERVGGAHFRHHFLAEIAESRQTLSRFAAIIASKRVDAVAANLEVLISRHQAMLKARASAVVEGHGDLRPEHICLEDPVVIFDCLEFSLRLRQVDPVDEMAFLAMECAQLGAPWAQPILFEICARRVPAWYAPAPLVNFYQAVHAFTRARLAALHMDDPDVREPEKWPAQTRQRLALAERLTQTGLENSYT